MTEPKDSTRWKYASSASEDAERLKGVQAELRAIMARLDEMADSDLGLSPETVKLLPKGSRSKSDWLDFPKAEDLIKTASLRVSVAARAIETGVSLAEAAQIAVSKK